MNNKQTPEQVKAEQEKKKKKQEEEENKPFVVKMFNSVKDYLNPNQKFRFLDCDALPGNALLCVHHFIHTMRKSIISNYEWSCSYSDASDLKKDDYDLYKNYSDHFSEINLSSGAEHSCFCTTEPEQVEERANSDGIELKIDEYNRIICDCDTCKYCCEETARINRENKFHSYDLIIGTYEAICEQYQFQELQFFLK
mgnify:CR=1 FL=1